MIVKIIRIKVRIMIVVIKIGFSFIVLGIVKIIKVFWNSKSL